MTLLALVAGGFAVAGGDGSEAKPLALMATNGGDGGGRAEMMSAAPAAAPAPGMASADASMRSSMPYPYWGGLKFEIRGDLPELDGKAAAWRASSPTLDKATVARIASALGLSGSPVQRDGGWWVDGGDWTLNAYPGEPWSVNYHRGRFDRRPDDAPLDEPAGPAISKADAERRVRDLLKSMGAPESTWKVEVTDTELGSVWGCPSPMGDEELTRLEAEKLRQMEQSNASGNVSTGTAVASRAPLPPSGGAAGSTPGAKPGPDAGVGTSPAPSCPPPPPPVKGFNVSLSPVLGGVRADWPVWNLTMRSDGRIENLYGTWVRFERAGEYKLRGTTAALEELRNPPMPEPAPMPMPMPAIEGGVVTDPAPPNHAVDGGPTVDAPSRPPMKGGPAFGLPAQTDGGAATGVSAQSGGGSSGSAGVATPAIAPAPPVGAIEPAPAVCPPLAMPMPAEKATATDDKAISDVDATSSYSTPQCVSPEPQVVTITGVEMGLLQMPVWEDGKSRLHLVPAYRFTGTFKDGSKWETSMVALHRDAIAPPPDFPVRDQGGDTPTVGKAVPPAPAAEPARPADR